MRKAFLLLAVLLLSSLPLVAKPTVEKLELRIDNLKDQVDSLELLIEAYEESQDQALLKVIFREQRILLSKLVKNYQRYKLVSKKKISLHIRDTKELLKQARINYLSTTKLSTSGMFAGFSDSPSYWDVYNSLKEDLDSLNTAIDEIEFSELLGVEDSGVYGKVSLITGDCTPGMNNNRCLSEFVNRTILIREATLYKDLNTGDSQALATVESNERGSFYITLEPGLYSVLVIEDGQEYCNSINGDGYACIVEVTEAKHSEFDIKIDYSVH